jgi:hypothetical protein
MKREGQEKRLLDLLRLDEEIFSYRWVSLPEILDLRPRIASHTRIISYLRQHGHNVECEETWVDGEMHTRYRLVSGPEQGD